MHGGPSACVWSVVLACFSREDKKRTVISAAWECDARRERQLGFWNLVFFSKCTQYTCTVPLGVCVPSKASSELCPEHRSVLGLNRYPRRMLLQVSRREECCRITSCDSSFA